MMKGNIIVKKDKNSIASHFAEFLKKDIVSKKGNYTIALSGGSTPKVLFEILAKDFSQSIPWDRVHLYWGDERCVPPDHEESNFLMTQKSLLGPLKLPKANIHRIKGEDDPKVEANRYAQEINQTVESSSFDMVMLGMGEDGHTASIFPDRMEYLSDPNTCVVATHPESGQKRVSLTGTVINKAQKVCFLVTGENKAEKLKEIVHQTGQYESYPASFIMPQSGELYWFVDHPAASKL